MEVIHGLEAFPKQRVPVVVALGTFDGLHLGHQALLALAVERARAVQGRCAVFTFDPHPRSVLGASPDGFLLTTLDERLELFSALGADLAVVVQFNDTFRRTSAEAWVTELVRRTMMAEVVCGANYVFGHDRRGNAALLRRLGGQHGFQVWTADPVGVDGAPVSSTRVRDALRAGRVTDAGRLLGRWYTLRGLVVRGDGRGRVLGYPTANLSIPSGKLIPAIGIYAGYARGEAGGYQTAISIGVRPTFGQGPLVVEAYLLRFTGNLYATPLQVYLAARLHDELTFSSVGDLIRQIDADVAAVPQALAEAEQLTGLGPPASGSVEQTTAGRSQTRSPKRETR